MGKTRYNASFFFLLVIFCLINCGGGDGFSNRYVVAEVTIPVEARELAASTHTVWVIDWKNTVFELDDTWAVASSFDLSLPGNCYGFTYGNGNLWALGAPLFGGDKVVIQADLAGGILSSLEVDGYNLTHLGSSLWSNQGSTIIEYNNTGSVISTFQFIETPDEIADDGTDLWMIVHNYVRNRPDIHRVDPSTADILDTYDIANAGSMDLDHDGSCFWRIDVNPSQLVRICFP